MSSDSLIRLGARIQASSNDERYPPKSVIDGRADTFWATGGTFPQQFTISFPSMFAIKSVTIYCYKVRDIMLEKSTKQIPVKFEALAEKELERRENDLNVEELVSGEFAAHHLRFTIRAAYDHFCSVHKVTLGGVAPSGAGSVEDSGNNNSSNLLGVSGTEPTPKLSPRHPKSAMRRRSESVIRSSPVKLVTEDEEEDSDGDVEADNRSSFTMVSGANTNFNRESGPNLLARRSDDLEDVPDADDEVQDLSLG